MMTSENPGKAKNTVNIKSNQNQEIVSEQQDKLFDAYTSSIHSTCYNIA
jgi:hypothetical protein